MDHYEFAKAKERILAGGESLEQWLGVDDATIRLWEGGTKRIPKGRARQVQWLQRFVAREEAMAHAGIQECQWAESQSPWPTDQPPDDPQENLTQYEAYLQRLESHAKDCEICQRRREYADAHPLPPFPNVGVWPTVFAALARVPPWLRPAAIGGAILGGIVFLRFAGAAVVTIVRSGPRGVGALLISAAPALLAAVGAGAAGGFAVTLTRPILRPLGAAGDYATGIVAVFAYMTALMLAAPIAFGEQMLEGRSDWVIVAVLSVVFGVVGAYSYRKAGPTKPAV